MSWVVTDVSRGISRSCRMGIAVYSRNFAFSSLETNYDVIPETQQLSSVSINGDGHLTGGLDGYIVATNSYLYEI